MESIDRTSNTYLDLLFGKAIGAAVEQLLEVLVEELEHERQLLVRVQHIDQAHDVGMLKLLEQGNFTDSGTRNTLLFGLETDGFERVNLAGVDVPGLMHNTVSTLADLLQLLVLVNL